MKQHWRVVNESERSHFAQKEFRRRCEMFQTLKGIKLF